MSSNEELRARGRDVPENKKAVYESYLNYMMIAESSIYDYEIVDISPEELEEEEL